MSIVANLMTSLLKAKELILGLIFPVYCVSCSKAGSELCITCLSKCSPALRPTQSWIYPVFDYRDLTIKKSINLIKYKYKKRILAMYADVLYGRIIEELADLDIMENFKNPILIPIPLSSKRLRERGFNQTEILCRHISSLDNNQNFLFRNDILIKPHDTVHQARIKDRGTRLKNLSGTFTVRNQNLVLGRNIILLDDVVTTGATLNEARKVLKASGAKKVVAFTIAH
ncbi:MAG: ComF family protein [Candidatus Pacebacteria bacterium]|jgi:ComF family protein|nr:ComF family protein [Candidatus Paceibacterota bacterium]